MQNELKLLSPTEQPSGQPLQSQPNFVFNYSGDPTFSKDDKTARLNLEKLYKMSKYFHSMDGAAFKHEVTDLNI